MEGMLARLPCDVCSFCFCIAISLPTSRLHSVSCTVCTPPHPYIHILYPQPHTVHTYTFCVLSHIQYIYTSCTLNHIQYMRTHAVCPQPHTVHIRPVSFSCICAVHTYTSVVDTLYIFLPLTIPYPRYSPHIEVQYAKSHSVIKHLYNPTFSLI